MTANWFSKELLLLQADSMALRERVLRLPLEDPGLNMKLDNFNYKGYKIANFEMETSVIYGLSKLLGHEALSLNAIIANRSDGTFSKNPKQTIDKLIEYALKKLVDQ